MDSDGVEGRLASFNGLVEELDFDPGRVKIGGSIFGRNAGEHKFEQVGMGEVSPSEVVLPTR